MHGIVHQRLKEYVRSGADGDAWETVLDRTDVEPTLYLAVNYYPDAEFEALFETLVELTGHERATLERDFGRFLAPTLRSTFRGHVPDDPTFRGVLCDLESVTQSFADQEPNPPGITGERVDGPESNGPGADDSVVDESGADDPETDDSVATDPGTDVITVTYESDRGYCAMARGLLEGLAETFDVEVSVAETACERAGADCCAFRVVISE